MLELLVEIGTEEIPARFLEPAIAYLKSRLPEFFDDLRLKSSEPKVLATPRRIVFVADVSEKQEDLEIVKTGPPKDKAFDADGNPTKAALGFARAQGVGVEELFVVSNKKGEFVAARKVEKGKPAKEVLEAELPNLILSIPFPKTMRRGAEKIRFARPIHWICALLGGAPLNFSLGSVESGDTSRGHRFMAPDEFKVEGLEQLSAELKKKFVILDQNDRKQAILTEARKAAERMQAELVLPDELLSELTYLVEYPSLYEGSFDPVYLELPEEVLITVMHHHQRYIPLKARDKGLLNRFLFISATPVKNPAVVIEGNERVLKARLEDAKFFFDEDRKKKLADLATELENVTFLAKLGSYAEKVERLKLIAKDLAQTIAPDKVQDAETAASICKSDLLTEMVGEFPELQGIMGRIHALHEGYDVEIAWAIEDHYKPRGAEDELPKTTTGALLSLAEKFDNLTSCFALGLIPTGTKDPYALRRQALGIIRILLEREWELKLSYAAEVSTKALTQVHKNLEIPEDLTAQVLEFIKTRMLYHFTSLGYPLDVVEAALGAGFDIPHDTKLRIDAIASFRAREDFDDLAISFKRVVNIIPKDFSPQEVSEQLFIEEAEKELWRRFREIADKVEPLKQKRRYGEALEIILELKPHIDKFFDDVLVMTDDESLRTNRLSMLAAIARLYATIADFKKLGGVADKN